MESELDKIFSETIIMPPLDMHLGQAKIPFVKNFPRNLAPKFYSRQADYDTTQAWNKWNSDCRTQLQTQQYKLHALSLG